MDEYSATDHSVILTQQGEEGKMQKQTGQLYKSFHDYISRIVLFLFWPLVTHLTKKVQKHTAVEDVIQRGQAPLYAVPLIAQPGASSFNISTVEGLCEL